MTLRTPRRRISPRTKRRYRAIKDFLRRALGSSSQPDIKINSSIAINVTDLKHKIVGLEQQLSEVNKHCRDLVCLEGSSRKDFQTLESEVRDELSSLKEQTEISSTKHVHGAETKLLYKTSESHFRKSDDIDLYGKDYNDGKGKNIKTPDDMAAHSYYRESKKMKKKSKVDNRLNALDASNPNLRKHRTQSVYENFVSSYSTSSYHSLIDPRTGRRKTSGHPDRHYEEKYVTQGQEYVEPAPVKTKVRRSKVPSRRNSPEKPSYHYEGRHRNKSKGNTTKELDQEFIADIIKRQYRPVKMFGQRQSELSQFSAPVCRDQEFPIRENIQEGSELCSCCFDGQKKTRYEYEHDLSDMRSICDTRLYSSKRNRHRHSKKHTDIYNDSTQYDIVPVKEKSSPKSRRKFAAESMTPYGYYKEVPPSPRTQRPRLNLKAQYYDEFEDYMHYKKKRGCSPKKSRIIEEQCDHYRSNESSEATDIHKEKQKSKSTKKIAIETHDQQDVGTMSSLQYPTYNTEPINVTNDSAFNKTQETDLSTDKTDKALNEIKDILQCFLQEIKKETVSQCDNSEITKTGDKCLNEFRPDSVKLNTTVVPNGGHSVNNFSVPQCSIPSPFMNPFANPCCYPVLPVCPMNCVQNGYIFPSPSYTCASCANNTKEDAYPKSSPKESTNNVKNNETDELIKEIYKFVAQSPDSTRRKDIHDKSNNKPAKDNEMKVLTSRSVGGSSKHSRHDAQVGTQKIKCYSKSCEAIGSRFLSDTSYSRINPTYSDTVLERLSLEATATESETEFSSEDASTNKKPKKNRFAKVLRSFGLFKKKKDVIEEVSESESTMEVDVKSKKPPFRQEVLNYMMHEQQYFNPPPQQSTPYNPQQEFPHGYGCHTGCPDHLNHVQPMQAPYDRYPHKLGHEHTAAAYRSNQHRPSAPPYPNPYEGYHRHSHNQPQVPLCLKEIEVKSIGTQSDRKMNIFKKLTKKMQGPSYPVAQRYDPIKNISTQTAKEANTNNNNNSRPPLFNWRALQAKVNKLDEPPSFNLKTQKKLAEGDLKMRNAMLKKLFYKRNPFSPRNLIVRTILGKDKSSYGEPPMMFRPRMFF